MRCLFGLTLTLLLARTASATVLLYEPFNYTVSDQLSSSPAGTFTGKAPANQFGGASNAWNGTTAPASHPEAQLITDNNLLYSGLTASTGKSYELSRTFQSNVARITLPGGPYGTGSADKTIYFSFLADLTTWVTTTDATASNTASQQGDFIGGFTASSGGGMSAASVYGGQVRIRREVVQNPDTMAFEQTGKYQLGIMKNNQTAANYGILTPFDYLKFVPTSFDVGATVLVVGEYELKTSDVTDDVVRLWINPSLGLSTAPTADLEITDGLDISTAATMPAGNYNQGNVAGFWFRDGSSVLPGKLTVDELRVGTDWASVTPASAVALLGDFNSDGKVDAGDYATWRKNEVANATLPNDNGLTDQAARFTLWRGNFGNPPGAGSGAGLGGAAVPEPSAMVLLLAGLAALSLRRRGRMG